MIRLKRGDVAIVLFPHTDLVRVKRRPALIVQADNLMTDLNNVIVAQITSNTARAGYPSRVLVTTSNRMVLGSGLKQDSVIMADNLVTIDASLIEKRIGSILLMDPVDAALRKTLAL